MKIRIKGDSIRYRLGQSEVALLRNNGAIEESTQFPQGRFVYRLQRSAQHDILSAEFKDGVVTVFIPESVFENFVNTQEVGFDGKMPSVPGKELYILVEKDFKCLDGTHEDQSDKYPNPLAEQHGR